MEFDFDRLKEQGLDLASSVKETAVDLANKGKGQVMLLEQQAKLTKAQRQLGALVYSLSKSGEDNQPLVSKYIEAIDEIEKTIDEIKASLSPEEKAADAAEEQAAAGVRVCPQCGAEVEADALFCNKCGAQL